MAKAATPTDTAAAKKPAAARKPAAVKASAVIASAGAVGRVTQVIGAVVDVAFEEGQLPADSERAGNRQQR